VNKFREFLHSGHAPTLWAALTYFTFSFAIWVINASMAPFISEALHLSPAEKGVMLSIPIFAGALLRFPLGLLAQYIGRKNATLVELGFIAIAMAYGYFFVQTFNDILAMGVLLGVAGASFGVAMSLGSGSFPARYKGLAMGIVGAGNIGTAFAALLAPMLAQKFGWQTVYGLASLSVAIPILVVIVFAKEPSDLLPHARLRDHLSCLYEKDGWAFSVIYVVTFGGFLGLASFLPSYFYDQFGVSKVQAGQLTMVAAFLGAVLRLFGGWLSDHWGGVNTLTVVIGITAGSLVLCGFSGGSLNVTMLLFMLCFSALGAGNGALFQLVPLRWPLTTAVAGSMIGEVGALGGGLIPTAMGVSKQYTGSYLWGFLVFAGITLAVLLVLRKMQIRWTRTWAEKGGRARSGPGDAGVASRLQVGAGQ
jgi:MFS transporter, NNP family, nitrate/nitrite transporter